MRHKYFGHGDVTYNLHANLNQEHAESVAKQVFVVRYLCRRLIDSHAPSGMFLSREMGFVFKGYSGHFTGQISQLEKNFRVDFDQRVAKVYDINGKKVEEYSIQ